VWETLVMTLGAETFAVPWVKDCRILGYLDESITSVDLTFQWNIQVSEVNFVNILNPYPPKWTIVFTAPHSRLKKSNQNRLQKSSIIHRRQIRILLPQFDTNSSDRLLKYYKRWNFFSLDGKYFQQMTPLERKKSAESARW